MANNVLREFIHKYPTDWEKRLEEKRIKVKYKGSLMIANYDILADFTDPIVRICRGIILDTANDYEVVCFPFFKFCNYGEKGADSIDWASARVQEKVDGSIMKMYYYNDTWQVASNGVISAFDAPITSREGVMSFGQIFMQAADAVSLDISKLDKDCTYIFELVSPYNRVVVDYKGVTTLYHTGTRNNKTGEEFVCDIGVPHPAEYPLHSVEECIKAAAALNSKSGTVEQEGFVVVDKDWHRVKIKSPEYVAIHHILPNGEITDDKIIDYIKEDIIDDIVGYIPSLADRVAEIKSRIAKVETEIFSYKYWNKFEVVDNKLDRATWAKTHNKDKYFSFGVKYIFDDVNVDLMSLSATKILKLIQ